MAMLIYVPRATIGGIDEYTVLMLHMDGDQSDSQHLVTTNGNPQLSTAISKFNGSIYFDGNGDYISIPDSDDWFLGNVYTIDFWVYRVGEPTYSYWLVCDQDTNNKWGFGYWGTSGIYLGRKASGIWTEYTSGNGTFSAGEWHHVAFVGDGTNTKIYVDGINTQSRPVMYLADLTSPLLIGQGFESTNSMIGYIDELRISKGIARWTSNFTPPAAPYTSDANTSLLLHFDGDVSATPHTITANGNPQLNASTAKFDGAMYFDGSGDYLTAPDSADWHFETGDFTVDYWINFEQLDHNGIDMNIVDICRGVNNGVLIRCSYSSHDVHVYTTGSTWQSFSWNPIIDTWYHMAIVRSSGVIRVYIDGTQIGTDWANTTNIIGTDGVMVGAGFHNTNGNT